MNIMNRCKYKYHLNTNYNLNTYYLHISVDPSEQFMTST